MRAWQIVSDGGVDALKLAERDVGAPGLGEVKVRMRASAINFRDLATIKDPGPRGLTFPAVPNSDGAGEIVEVGEGVIGLKPGDRVASCFFQDWADGPCSPEIMASALGGALDGVLAEEVILKAGGVIPFPEHMSFEDAATLPCAALTAWNAVVETGGTKAGDTVLLLGTGGVSIYALQFLNMLGARVIITSSSDEKLARAKQMGAWKTVNYRQTPDWDQEVLKLTGGRGVDLTVEVGGPGTLQKSIEATRVAGTIGLIGILVGGEINPLPIMRKSLRVQGIYVGSRRMFADMNRAIAAHGLKPVIHETFAFEEAKSAYHAMEAAGHFGKLVVKC
ncbi:MAG: NAD(P)-dependent alcohol dehydrogenase [Alphaproteobacteria bacterium]|nr:NAD(P)-dependent alcohol dehydrogenase [Alphaproteobacteria bacterium]